MSEESGLGLLERSQPLLLIFSMFFGWLVGSEVGSLDASLNNTIIFCSLVALMFGIALGTPIKNVFRSFTNVRFFIVALTLNFLFVPAVGYLLGRIFLSNEPEVLVGFILYVVMPCTDWFLVFTAMAKGNVALGLALLPINLIVQVLLIPIYLWLFAGEIVPFQVSALFETVLVFILIPFFLAYLALKAVRHGKAARWKESIEKKAPMIIQTASLMALIFFMFSGQTKIIQDNLSQLLLVLVPVLIFIIISFVTAYLVSDRLKLSYGEYSLLTCTTIARNSPLALAIAFGLFPDQPLIQVAIFIGVVIELPMLVLVVSALLRIENGYGRTVT